MDLGGWFITFQSYWSLLFRALLHLPKSIVNRSYVSRNVSISPKFSNVLEYDFRKESFWSGFQHYPLWFSLFIANIISVTSFFGLVLWKVCQSYLFLKKRTLCFIDRLVHCPFSLCFVNFSFDLFSFYQFWWACSCQSKDFRCIVRLLSEKWLFTFTCLFV